MKRYQLVLFLVVILGILGLANSIVYLGFVRVFQISSPIVLIWLRAIFAFLGVSFVLATLVSARFDNILSRSFYWLSAIWLGFSFYFVLAAVFYRLLSFLPGLDLPMIGYELFGLALLIGLYGLLHARSLTLTPVHLELVNLPEAWHNKCILWLSDLHLGPIYRASDLARLVAIANALAPDLVVLGGDLFDGAKIDVSLMVAPLRALRAPYGVVFVTGNHDGFTRPAEAELLSVIRDSGVRVLNNELITLNGLQIVGANYRDCSDRTRFAEFLSQLQLDPARPSILLKHVPSDIDLAAQAGFSVQLSGHTHRAQLQPLGIFPRLVYSGFDYGLRQGNGIQVFTSSGVGTWGPPLRIGTSSELVLIQLTAR